MFALQVMVIVFFLFLLLRVPISVSLACSALMYFLLSGQPVQFVTQRLLSGVNSFPLLAIPLFVFAGTVMARGGLASAILEFADTVVGHWRGGLAQVTILNSTILGAMTGSAVADAAIDAKVIVPVMRRKGYTNEFSSAVSASAGILGPLIPPGIGLVLYALSVEQSVGRLFLASLVPAIVLAIGYSLAVMVLARLRGYQADRPRRATFGEVLKAFWKAAPALGMPVLLLVGLRMGVFTPTELAGIAAVYSLVVGTLVYRGIRLSNLLSVAREAVLASGMVMFLLAGGTAFGYALTREGAARTMAEFLTSVTGNAVTLLLIINILLLILGCLMDGNTLIIMLAPILAVAAVALGVDPIQFGVIMVMNVTIGALTPPVGVVLLSVVGMTQARLGQTIKEMLPFLLVAIGVLALTTYVPALSTWFPDLVMGSRG